MTGVFLQEVLRILNCMSLNEFADCFGDMGHYLWEKFEGKDFDVFAFVCYLDPGNAQKLVKYAERQMSVDILNWTEEQWNREQAAIARLFKDVQPEKIEMPKPKKFIVRRLQDMQTKSGDSLDTSRFGNPPRKLGKWEFDSFEAALAFYEERKMAALSDGLKGEYFSYPEAKS